MSSLYESGYRQFQCLGADCEATCCYGWRVDIDKETYHQYKRNQHPVLKHLFRQAIKRNQDVKDQARFGQIVMDENGYCSFMERGLCRIHSLLGPQALSGVCATYPRVVIDLVGQKEYSLYLSCPEAARLVLLQREGVKFVEHEDGLPGTESGPRLEPGVIQAVSEIRALIIFVLQYRAVSIETRLVMLGLLLEVIDAEVLPMNEESVAQLPALMVQAQQLLEDAGRLEAALATLKPSETLQLKIFGGMVECLKTSGSPRFVACVQEAGKGLYYANDGDEGGDGLSQRMSSAVNDYYAPFFAANPHILENYLVHLVFQFVLPFRNEEALAQYRHLVVNFLTFRLVLLGMAAHNDMLTEEIVIRLVSSFARFSEHNRHYVPHLVKLLDEHGIESFRDLFVLFAGGGRSPEAGS